MFFISVIILLVISWYTSQIAEQKGRSPLIWFTLAFLFSFFALIAVILLPPAEAPVQKGDENTIEVEPVVVEKTPQFETETWYYLDQDRRQQGPFPYRELKNLWLKRTVGVQSYVWCPNMSGWKRIGELTDLIDSLSR